MSSLNITSHKTNQLFTFHDQVWSFSARVYSWKDFSTCSLGTKAGTILKSSWPFSFVHFCLRFYFPYLKLVRVHGSIFLKIWNLFFHRYQDCPKGASILTGLAEIINKAIKGLNFLHLWGERRALRWRSVTSGWQFSSYVYWVKPR